ncbi:MAG: hypothetical protein ACKO23_06435, partial [Gemmataceae bacterium]
FVHPHLLFCYRLLVYPNATRCVPLADLFRVLRFIRDLGQHAWWIYCRTFADWTDRIYELLSGLFSFDADARDHSRKRFQLSAIMLVGAILGTLCNPYGPGLYSWIFKLVGDAYFMDLHQEWQSPNFHFAGAFRYEIFFLLALFLLGLTSRRPSWVELGLAVFWLHMALFGYRYVALWILLILPMLALSSIQILYLNRLCDLFGLHAGPETLFHTPNRNPSWLLSFAFSAVLLAGLGFCSVPLVWHNPKHIATEGLDYLLERTQQWEMEQGRRPRLYHAYDWGGYLTLHAWPRILNWIDDRNEVQGKQHIVDHFDAERGIKTWREVFPHADFACVKPATAIEVALSRDPKAWQTIYRDEYSVVFERIPDR